MEKSYFEAKLKLDRLSGEKQALLEENGSLEKDRDDLRTRLRQTAEENVQIKERFVHTTLEGPNAPELNVWTFKLRWARISYKTDHSYGNTVLASVQLRLQAESLVKNIYIEQQKGTK